MVGQQNRAGAGRITGPLSAVGRTAPSGLSCGEYRVRLRAEGAVALQDDNEIVLNLAEHEQRLQSVTILGRTVGAGTITVSVKGPNGIAFDHALAVGVRAPVPPVTRHVALTLKQGASSPLDTALTSGLRPETVMLSVAASTTGSFDLPGLARELRQLDYQSTEAIVDQATPSLAAPSVAADLQLAVRRLFDSQGADGGFTLWGAGASDPWLTAYVAEFLSRARNAGASIPEAPFSRALDYLAMSSVLEPAPGGPDQPPAALESAAYASKVLAINKRLDIFQLRYFSDRIMPAVHAPVTIALLAASFAILDDKGGAASLFAQAQAASAPPSDAFGSDLRDHALLAALMAESGAVAPAASQAALARAFADSAAHRQFSAQEAAWIFRAASALPPDSGVVNLKIGDKVFKGGAVDLPPRAGEATLSAIKNLGDTPVRAAVTISGLPAQTEVREASSYEVQRAFFDTTGKAVEPMNLRQNDMIVVVVSGRYSGQSEARPVVIDSLPAGWEMEAASIADPGARYPWLKDLSGETAASFEGGVYNAAPILAGDKHEFKIAYVIRAATRGQFAMPGTLVEDMAQPALSARGVAGRTKIDAPAL
jgi:uncharacterized protein YfaS (alpha-2-macroglobulin family)